MCNTLSDSNVENNNIYLCCPVFLSMAMDRCNSIKVLYLIEATWVRLGKNAYIRNMKNKTI